MNNEHSKEFLDLLASVAAKRPKTVIDHILKNGFITTEELKNLYGYNHPPRAVRDVREHGIPIETFRVVGTDGRKIAAYKFGDFKKEKFSKLSGRTALSKKIKEKLIEKYGSKDFIYGEKTPETLLQIDHRIPYEVSGEPDDNSNIDNFMLLSASANRAKSWSCEHCKNWQEIKKREVCLSCYWAYPENYTHVAMKELRRVDLIWEGSEVSTYEAIKGKAKKMHKEIQEIIKEIIEIEIKKKED
ncbi:TPA: HNH endonuclease [Legionella pneumophila]|nr:HNH endonuclease [Legionella pneumophila]